MEIPGSKPPPEQTGKYRVILKEAPDLKRAAEVIVRRTGVNEGAVYITIRKLPAEVATNLDPLYAEDLAGSLRDIGAVAEKRIIPSSVVCSIHFGQPGRALCAVCGKVLCKACIDDADGQTLCAEHSGKNKEPIPSTFPWIRITLLLVLIGVGVYAYITLTKARAPFPWNRPYRLAVVGFMVDLPESWRTYVETFNKETGTQYIDMKNHTLPDAAGWFQREYTRYGGSLPQALELKIFGPFNEDMPPPPPPTIDMQFFQRYTQWKRFKNYFIDLNKRHELKLDDFDGVLYVEFVQGSFDKFLESWASKSANIGLVQCFLNEGMIEQNIMIVTHEFFHLINAQDHYDQNGNPKDPEGLANPFQEPLFPQNYADIMAGRVATDANSSREIIGLSEVRVNIYTAHEVGWIADEAFQEMLKSRQIPALE